jgi:hypothetical protein
LLHSTSFFEKAKVSQELAPQTDQGNLIQLSHDSSSKGLDAKHKIPQLLSVTSSVYQLFNDKFQQQKLYGIV